MCLLYYSLTGCKPFVGDHIEERICKATYNDTKLVISNTSNGAQDMIKKLLTVDFNIRLDFDKILRHIWFEKDMLMKQKVNDLIAEYSRVLKSNKIPTYNKENITKKLRFCPCFSPTSSSDQV